jgi:hypothetical protein
MAAEADRPTALAGTATVHVQRPALDVWRMVTNIRRMGEWSPETVSASWSDGASGPVPGARFRGKNRRGLIRWTTHVRVDEADVGESFVFTVLSGARGKRETTRWTYRFVATPDGGCDVTESYETLWEPAYSRLVFPARRRKPQLDEGIATTLERLKAAAEAGL